jgi:hypothetical protein
MLENAALILAFSPSIGNQLLLRERGWEEGRK